MVAVFFAQVFFRYVLGPYSLGEESARFMFAWVAFLGASVAVKNKSHTGVELFASYLPRRAQHIIAILAYLVCIFFVAMICIHGWQLASSTMTQRSPAMQLPMFYPYLSVPLGCLFDAGQLYLPL